MSDEEKTTGSVPAKDTTKRSRRVGIIAALAGILAAVVGLVGVLSTDEPDLLYVLVFAGGMLVGVLGLRRLRQSRTK